MDLDDRLFQNTLFKNIRKLSQSLFTSVKRTVFSAMVLMPGLLLAHSPVFAQDRSTYDAGSRPRVFLNWESFETSGFPPEWRIPVTNVVINAYTRIMHVAGVDVRPQFFNYTTRTDSDPGEIVISANMAHETSTRLASTFGWYPDRLKIVFHRNSGRSMTPWNFTPFFPDRSADEISMYGVMMHEMLHSLGMDHLSTEKSIMSGGGYHWDDHFGPWKGDVAELRAQYPLRDTDRLRAHVSTNSGSTWSSAAADISGTGASTTHPISITSDRDDPFYLLGWTTPDRRLSWIKTNGQDVQNWSVYGGGPEVTFGTTMKSGNSNNHLWGIVRADGDQRKLRILRSRNDGVSWGYVGSPSVETYATPAVATTQVDGRDAWIAAWSLYDATDPNSTGLIQTAVSFNNGNTWSAPDTINTFYRSHAGVSLDCSPSNNCLLGFVWGGSKGSYSYGQNRVRYMKLAVDAVTNKTLVESVCLPATNSRVAPAVTFDPSGNQYVTSSRKQNRATSLNTMTSTTTGCPAPVVNVANSNTHIAPGMAASHGSNELLLWSAHD